MPDHLPTLLDHVRRAGISGVTDHAVVQKALISGAYGNVRSPARKSNSMFTRPSCRSGPDLGAKQRRERPSVGLNWT